jgi:hypothetical protein
LLSHKESVEIESVLEVDILCSSVSKKPRYEQPIFDSYDDDRYCFLGKPVFNNEEQFSHVGQKIPLGMSFEAPPLFDHYGDNDEDVEVFFEEKGISIHSLLMKVKYFTKRSMIKIKSHPLIYMRIFLAIS